VSKNKMEELLGFGPIERNRIVPGKQPIEGRSFAILLTKVRKTSEKFLKR